MSYGNFNGDGTQYRISTPLTPARWFNYLFNDSYYMEVSETGQGKSTVFLPKHREYNREGYKLFYLLDHDSGERWCPFHYPLRTEPESYSCIHSLGWSEIRSESNGIETTAKVFVPREGMCEIWSVTLKNKSEQARAISLFSAFAIENGGVMGSVCDFDQEQQVLSSFSFPYHVFYEEKEKCDDHSNLVYLFTDVEVNSYECSERRFFGGDSIYRYPQALQRGRCTNMKAEADNPVAAFQHTLVLEAAQSKTINLVLGCARTIEDVKESKERIFGTGIDLLLQQVEEYWANISAQFTVETPDENINYFMNHWLKKQIVLQTRTNRMSTYCPIRNQLQDALGYAVIDPQAAVAYMESVLVRQERSGFIQQWIMTDGSPPQKLCLLTHKDGPVWLVICWLALVHQAGDASILDRQVGFKDGEGTASVYEHLLLAVEYMAADTGTHGLCLMGHGDWNDPINGPGRLGKGESAWSTMALKYACNELLVLSRLRNDASVTEALEQMAARLDQAINDNCWDGAWYVAGFDDEGEAFGTARDEEGQLFLNTQTWAIMSGVARGQRLEQCLEAIDSLDTAAGPLLLKPAFSQWNPKWGRISIKLMGTTENGSVYCHASMFKAFADCRVGRGQQAYDTIRKTLPTNPDNPPEVNLQVPIFIPNFYFGLDNSPNFGQSSHHNSTGTVGWMAWTMLDYVLGIRATVAGLQITPCVPADWQEYRVTRKFRSATYQIQVLNPDGVQEGIVGIRVNGVDWEGMHLPYEENQNYQVEVMLG